MLAILLLLSTLFACHPNEEGSLAPTTEQTATAETSPTSLDEMPYKRDNSKYAYITTAARDRGWEEDIVYLADSLLDPYSGHPKLTERGCNIHILNGLKDGYEDVEYSFDSLYSAELHEEFLRRINELLLSIGEKSDEELLFGCAEAVAILNDGHTSIVPFSLTEKTQVFPLGLVPIYTDGVLNAYICAAPSGMDDLLLCRLDAINGTPLSEIVEAFGRIVSHENMNLVEYISLNDPGIYFDSLILNCSFLRYFGIMGEERSALFSLTDETGATLEVKLSSATLMDYPSMVFYQPSAEPDEDVAFRNISAKDVWYEMLDGGKTIYVCILQCSDASDQKVRAALHEAKKSETVEKVILDFRGNGGGNLATSGEIAKALEQIDAPGGKFVLVDGGSYSAAVLIPVALRRFCTNVVLVGEPAGMPPNGGFGSGGKLNSPNRHIIGSYAVRDRFVSWPGNDDPALMPDVIVYQTLEDYKNGIDTVLNNLLRDSDK